MSRPGMQPLPLPSPSIPGRSKSPPPSTPSLLSSSVAPSSEAATLTVAAHLKGYGVICLEPENLPSKERHAPLQYRDLEPSREAKEVFTRWINYLDDEFTKHKKPALRAELVRDNLHQLLLGRPHGGRLNFTLTSELPFNVLELSLDPANVTLEPEYYGDIDATASMPASSR